MIYYILPHLARTGGIKVSLQHIHILRNSGYPAEGIIMSNSHGVSSPFARYDTPTLHMYPQMPNISPEDTLVFIWPLDFPAFENIVCKKVYFAQGCISVNDMPGAVAPFEKYVANDPNMGCLAVSNNTRSYNAIAYKKESALVRNWIDTQIFKPGHSVKKRIGMINHRHNYDPHIGNLLIENGFTILDIGGSEEDVARLMGSCDYFIQCSQGLWNGYEYTEGFGIPGAEAMASGAILLTYNTKGVLEYALDKINSVVFETPEELLGRLKILEENPEEKESLREIGIKTIQAKFDAQTILNEIIKGLQL